MVGHEVLHIEGRHHHARLVHHAGFRAALPHFKAIDARVAHGLREIGQRRAAVDTIRIYLVGGQILAAGAGIGHIPGQRLLGGLGREQVAEGFNAAAVLQQTAAYAVHPAHHAHGHMLVELHLLAAIQRGALRRGNSIGHRFLARGLGAVILGLGLLCPFWCIDRVVAMQMAQKNDVDIPLELERIVHLGDHCRVCVARGIADRAVKQYAQLAHLVVPVGDPEPGHAHILRRGVDDRGLGDHIAITAVTATGDHQAGDGKRAQAVFVLNFQDLSP